MTRLYFDIETLPAIHWTEEEVDAYVRSKVPANYSKPETIEKWVVENKLDVFSKTALDWKLGHILCIGVALEEYPPVIIPCDVDPTNDEVVTRGLWDFIEREVEPMQRKYLTWVGHNIISFDLRWLFARALRWCPELALCIPWRRNDRSVEDTAHLWVGPDYKSYVKLDDVCSFMGFKTKEDSGLSGDKVYEAWMEGRIEEIHEYCLDDVERVRMVRKALDAGGVR
jgi:predicted PolB exonuclease-like 3'-5' exonuclease